jgi:uncharacterized protein (TIGR02246 family)
MPARSPEECNRLFGEYVSAGDLDKVVALYEESASFVQHDGRVARGHAAIRQALSGLVAMRPKLRLDVVKVVAAGAGDLAIVYDDWAMSATDPDGNPRERAGKAIEVMRRQADGSWKLVIDDPYARG